MADQLDRLLPVFERLKEAADTYASGVDEFTSISGDQTGPRCCPEAGDALRTGLQRLVDSFNGLGAHALNVRSAVQATVSNYRATDEASVANLRAAGGDL